MRDYETVSIELEDSKKELEEVEQMSEEEACFTYNVNSKEEIIVMINEDINILVKELRDIAPVDFDDDEAVEIFGSHEAMNRYLF